MHRKYRNLDMLRAIAVLWVFVCHAVLMLRPGPTINWMAEGIGRFGVILFFFHTSFVLMQSLEALGPASPKWAATFYIRRAFRIYPLAILIIGLALITRVPFAPWAPAWHEDRGMVTVLANFLLSQNLLGKPSVIAPLWSLPIEIQMYAVLPLVFRLFERKDWRKGMALCLTGAAAAAAVVYAATRHLNTLAFVPCFFSGALAYKITRDHTPTGRAAWWFPSILAVTALGVLFTLDIPVEWILCFALAWIFPHLLDMRASRLATLCEWTAKYSYGIYLTHVFGLWIGFTLLGKWLDSTALRVTASVAITGVASALFFHLVENPLIQLGKRIAPGGDAGRRNRSR